MQRSVYLGALVLSLCMAATVAVPVLIVDVPANDSGEPYPQPTVSDTNFELLGEDQLLVPGRRIDEGTGFESGENVNGIAGNGPSTDSTAAKTNIRNYCRCYEIPGGYEFCVTVVFEETEDGELVTRKRRFVRSISSK